MCTDRILKRNIHCPNCHHDIYTVIHRKYIVTELRRCARCALLYRSPSDSQYYNDHYYNNEYSQGFTSSVPSEVELQQLVESEFKTSPKNYQRYIDVICSLGMSPGDKLFDFGCSWGYGSWQLSKVGFNVVSAEISRCRREFAASKLGVEIVEDPWNTADNKTIAGTFDGFFSCHVLEHVPVPRKIFDLAAKLLKRDGLFISVTPNGSTAFRQTNKNWAYALGRSTS